MYDNLTNLGHFIGKVKVPQRLWRNIFEEKPSYNWIESTAKGTSNIERHVSITLEKLLNLIQL
jgi:hypothetical protein